ncbi:MAG TPA: SCO family protein [Thermoanaerobaculia bacterium]|nr:SCO family protein [Thermoanaerobaculia bacterium]
MTHDSASATKGERAPDGTASGRGRLIRRALLWGLLVGVLVALAVAFALHRFARPAPEPLPVLGEIPDFRLTDHAGRTVGRGDLAGAPFVADLVFTRCVLACPLMTTRMAALDRAVPALAADASEGAPTPPARLVSISVDPEHDSPEVLADYARRHDASDRWLFLTGDRDEIYRLAGEGMKLGFDPNPPPAPLAAGDDIYHSTRFVLVDAEGRVRGYYDSGNGEELARLRADLARLIAAASA